jgi:hypothetical protein
MTTQFMNNPEQAPRAVEPSRGKRRRGAVKWIGGIATAVITAVLVLIFTNWVKPPPHPPMGGYINDIEYVSTNPCCQFSVNFTLKGFKGQRAHLEAIVNDSDANTAYETVDLGTARPDADEDQASFPAELPIERAGDFDIAFVLFDPRGTELARKTTGIISVG